jgi:putative peptide zinc metalloprotease protein
MLQLREDLTLVPAHGDDKFLVRDPNSGEVFEFGEREAFLIEALRGPYDAADLVAAFNARFDVSHGPGDLQDFLAILGDWGLLEASPDGAGPGPATASGRSGPEVPVRTEGGSRGVTVATAPVLGQDEDGAQDDGEDEIQRNNRWHLFRPEGFFDALDRLLSPLRLLVWLIPVLFVYGVAAIWFNRFLVAEALGTAKIHFGVIGRLVFASLTVNLISQLLRGVVARHYGLRVPSFGIVLEFGLVPRFNTQIIPTLGMSKADRLWLITASMLARVVLFATGVTLWLVTRPTGSLLSTVGAELALISAVGFLFVANPLWRADGYNLLSTLMGAPNLRQRADNALRGLLHGQPEVLARYAKGSWVLAIYALASMAFLVGLVVFLAVTLAGRLESQFQGAGVALFLVVFAYVVHNYFRRARSIKEAKLRRAAVAKVSQRGARLGPLALAQEARTNALGQVSGRPHRHRPARRRWLGYLVLGALAALLFLPYPYEVGGDVTISPIDHRQIYAETDGVIEEVKYNGGEWVEQGTVIAQMANHRQQKDVMSTRASILGKQSDIDKLRTTPSPESIRLAEEQLATARLQLRYSIDEADRIEKLFVKQTVSVQSWDDAKKKRDVARQTVEEKQASLEALKAQINPNEIAAAQAELQKLKEDLSYYEEQLRRTSLRMPITGRITTTNLMELQNKYLEMGMLFAEMEDSRQVRVEIAVPEADMREVSIGDPVRLKIWSDSGRTFHGTVTEIPAKTTAETYGAVVKVIAILPNPDQLLKTGMTGYAKIQAEETLLIVAFTKAWVRFLLITVWSWLP